MAKDSKLTVWLLAGPKLDNISKEDSKSWKTTVDRHGLVGAVGECAIVTDKSGFTATMLLGIGAKDKKYGWDWRSIYEAGIHAAQVAKRHKFDVVVVGGVPDGGREAVWAGLEAGKYSFKIGKKKKPSLKIDVMGITKKEKTRAGRLAEGRAFARDLVNIPPSDKSPKEIVSRLRREFKGGRGSTPVKIKVLDEKKLSAEKCRGILAVGRGSVNPPRVVVLEYAPPKAKKHIGLVGKGITFDSGGLSLKTSEGMKTMKCDMAGAAAVAGALKVISALGLKVRITAYLGFAENMPSGNAFKPGDVITMRSGKTVEVLNTDAEGRLVLADLLDMACGNRQDYVIDVATLTGACVVALGDETAGLFSNDDDLATDIIEASRTAGESFWRLPLGRDYSKKMEGSISDLKNIGGRMGGASTAAAFLQEFVGSSKWAHIDIAGPSFRESSSSASRPGGATGIGVSSLVRFAEECAG